MDFKNYWTYLILIALGLILFSIYLIANEIINARRECDNIDGDYKISFLLKHFCNGKSFIKYNSCIAIGNKVDCNLIWTYEDSINKINVSEFIK